jgi:DNA-binding response OmpR family regulator
MKSIHILLIEDNEDDISLTTTTLEENFNIDKITAIREGQSPFSFFETSEDRFKIPDLVLLDVNLSKGTGQEASLFIKKTKAFCQMPVIMLTTSSSTKNNPLAQKFFTNCYITKPIDGSEFITAIARIEDLWTRIVSVSCH